MLTISKHDTTLTEDGLGLITDASTIGLAAGLRFPDIVSVIDPVVGDGFLFFVNQVAVGPDGAEYAKYATRGYATKGQQFTLTIFND